MQRTLPPALPNGTRRVNSFDDPYLEQIVMAIAGGDGAALAHLFQLTSSQLRAILLNRLHCREDTEEVLFDIYAYVWQSAAAFDRSRGTVGAWLGIMARNKSTDRLRARRSTWSLNDERHKVIVQSLTCELLGPEDHLRQKEISASVERALQALSPLRRHIVRLSFFNGLAHHEIAEAVGLPLGTVKSHLRRGLASLRNERLLSH